MHVLLTGATGFLGGATLPKLLERGHEVRATGRDAEKGMALLRDGVTFVPADLGHDREVARLLDGIDVVVHAAALSSPWGDPAAFHRANVLATRYLLAASEGAGVSRFVHVSSPSVHAGLGDRFAIREDDPQPGYALNAYIASKRQAEVEVRRSRLPHVILRPRAIFGPGDTTLLPRLLRALGAGRLPVLGDGKAVVDLTYVDNVAQAIALAIEAPERACGQAYHVTNGEPIELWPLIRELCARLELPQPRRSVPFPVALALAAVLEQVAKRLPGAPEPPLTPYTVTVLARSTTLDVSRAMQELGYVPEVGMREGVERFLTWWEQSHGRA